MTVESVHEHPFIYQIYPNIPSCNLHCCCHDQRDIVLRMADCKGCRYPAILCECCYWEEACVNRYENLEEFFSCMELEEWCTLPGYVCHGQYTALAETPAYLFPVNYPHHKVLGVDRGQANDVFLPRIQVLERELGWVKELSTSLKEIED
ncbi:MAG: hypothetical protein OXF06_13120 [Bacteroidetes bacterium]|nr:hypothetical protein [Bacteroidota bacterium]